MHIAHWSLASSPLPVALSMSRSGSRVGWMALVSTTVLAVLLLLVCTKLPRDVDLYHASIRRLPSEADEDRIVVPGALFPEVSGDTGSGWMAHNSRALRALLACLATNECAQRRDDVVILGSRHFLGARRGQVGGEAIWANSMMAALDELGYTTLFADNMQRAVTLHALFPSLVRAVVADEWDMQPCADDSATCVKSARNPLGIPAWKLFSFSFFKGVSSPLPLGDRWVLAPEDYPGSRHVYIGYSVERTCSQRAVVKLAEREPAAYVLGKHKLYWQERFYAWDGVDWSGPPANLSESLGLALPKNFKFVACADKMYAADPEKPLPNGIENMCRDKTLSQAEFVQKLSMARLLVGVGRPWVSPTPYDALCLGVPFLNPIHSLDAHEPENREKWITQHDGLKFEDEQLVYNVRKAPSPEQRNHDFWEAVLRALNTPIQRHVPERMTMAAVKSRVDSWLQHDWQEEAEALMDERLDKGQQVYML